jgi:hypothetical protein
MPDRTHAFLQESLKIGPLLAPASGLGDDPDLRADFGDILQALRPLERSFRRTFQRKRNARKQRHSAVSSPPTTNVECGLVA